MLYIDRVRFKVIVPCPICHGNGSYTRKETSFCIHVKCRSCDETGEQQISLTLSEIKALLEVQK